MRAAVKQVGWVLLALLAACGGGKSGPECGPGTALHDGQCVPIAAGIDACGPGTALDGSTCVPEGEPDAGATDVGPDAQVDAAGDATAVTCSPACGKGQYCDELGACQTNPLPASWTCAKAVWADGATCDCGCGAFDPDCANATWPVSGCPGAKACQDDGKCPACTPACTGKSCGDDGCGGSCGACLDPAKPVCSGGQCSACVPNCSDKSCGDDGCGGSCGACATGKMCAAGACVFPPPSLSCVGHCGGEPGGGCSCTAACQAKGNCCVDVGVCGCLPNCAGKDCGDDGCGGTCGICPGGSTCVASICAVGECTDATCSGNGTCAGLGCACQPGYAGKFCDQCAAGYVNYPDCVTACASVLECNDGNPCTADACSAKSGCTHLPTDATCTDGSACTSGDACVLGACEPTLTTGCDDADPCTADACDPAVGCSHLPGGITACDDGNACTGNDSCANGSCAGSPVGCDDGNVCSADSCDAGSGCVHLGTGATCTDGDACSLGGVCNGITCTSVGAKSCDDGNGCTLDVCDGGQGACVHTPASATTACDDDDLCTSGEMCDGNGQCGGGAKICAMPTVGGLVGHYSAAQPSSLNLDAAQHVVAWQDQGGAGRTLTAIDVQQAPQLVPAGIHGRRALLLTGAGLASEAYADSGAVSLFAVVCTPASGSSNFVGHGGTWALASAPTALAFQGGGGSIQGAASGDSCYVVAARVGPGGGDLLLATGTSSLATDLSLVPTATTAALAIGDGGGLIGELLVYDGKVADADRDALVNYLRTAWGFEPPQPDFVWYEAGDTPTVQTDDAGNVSQWKDKSMLNRHALLGAATAPVWYANGTSNGRPALRFDGANVLLQTAAIPGVVQLTAFVVCELDAPAAAGSVFAQGQDSHFALRKDESAATPALAWSVGQDPAVASASYTAGKWAVYVAVQDGTSALLGNGSLTATGQSSAAIPAASEVLTLGNAKAGGASMGGFLAEIRAYAETLAPIDRAFVQGLLRTKYGL